MNFKSILTTFLLAASGLVAVAQQTVNTKFGKPTKEELEMTVYEPDSSADAVVLCRLTTVEYTIQRTGYLVDYHEKVRVKVLRPEGVSKATVVVPYMTNQTGKSFIRASKFGLGASSIEIGATNQYFENNHMGSLTESAIGEYANESVEDIKATAFNLVGGKVVKSQLKRSQIEKLKLDDTHAQVSFTVPEVRTGTVIEYEYTLHSELFYMLHDWYAQCDIPVAYACLDMDIPKYLVFNIEEQGIQRLACRCEQGIMHYKLESDAIAAPATVATNHYICVGRNLRAIPKDDYLWSPNDHCAAVVAELKSYSLRGTMQMDYARTWDQIDTMILEDEELGRQLDDRSPLADELKAAGISDVADEQERAALVARLIMGRVKWNGDYRLWPRPGKQVLKAAEGSNADINLLLIQALREVGLTAAPVVLRTRDEGLIPYNFPSIRKLSTFVVAVALSSGRTVYMDASSGPYANVLSEPLLVERARLVRKGGKGQWVNLQGLMKAQTSVIIDAVLSADGRLTGKSTTRRSGLAAMKQLLQADHEESGYSPEVTTEETVSISGTVADGRISICPFPCPPMKDNPFWADKRLAPVQFPCLRSDQVVVNIVVPDGYVLESEPVNTVVSTPDKGIDGRLFTEVVGQKLQLRYQFNVNKLSHPEKNYDALRGIFAMFSAFSNKALEFRKVN